MQKRTGEEGRCMMPVMILERISQGTISAIEMIRSEKSGRNICKRTPFVYFY